QLERLHFNHLSGRSRNVMRWRVLKRLVDERVLLTLERPAGSSPLHYGLDSAGLRLIRFRARRESPDERLRRPRVPGERFVAHTLAVTELFVTLRVQTESGRSELMAFETEAAAYWPDGLGGLMKPDAFVKLRYGSVTDLWWYEADLATVSLPPIRAKLIGYLEFVQRGQLGPDGTVPRVLIGVPTAKRQAAIQAVVEQLPEPAAALFVVADMAQTAAVMLTELQKE